MKIFNPTNNDTLLKYTTSININSLVSGILPDVTNVLSLEQFTANNNSFTGNFPDISRLTNLWNFQVSNNKISGVLPNLSQLSKLIYLQAYTNKIEGNVPAISNLAKLKSFHFGSNLLSGSFPFWQNLPQLEEIYLYTNLLSESIASLGNLPKLKIANFSWNTIVSVSDTFAVPPTLKNFEARGNKISQDSINKILVAFDNAGATGGTLRLDLGQNAPPSGAGLTSRQNLLNRGWNVTTS